MSDQMRWRYGDTKPVVAKVDSNTVIKIGDLLYLSDNKAVPAANMTLLSDTATTQTGFSTVFLGVAMQHSGAGESAPIRISTSGIFEFECPSAVYELGDLVGIYVNTTDSVLENQMLTKVSSTACAIGRVWRYQSAATTSILVYLNSTIMKW